MSLIQIGEGHVHHSRTEGANNSFGYPTFFIYFRSDQESELREIFSKKFHGLLSFHSKDYLKGEAGALHAVVKKFLIEECNYIAEQVWLHTLPRMFGYAFNPVSFWMCYRNSELEAVLVEVNNTFGERHFYWIYPGNEIKPDFWYRAEKVFHVSPFFPVDGFYEFRFQCSEKEMKVDINYHRNDGALRLITWVTGRLSPLKLKNGPALFAKYGWMTIMVVLRIHYQALRLLVKKSRYFRKPPLPDQEISS